MRPVFWPVFLTYERQIMNASDELACLKQIIASMPAHVYWKDKEGNYLGANNNQLNALGLSSIKEIHGKSDYDFFSRDQAERLRQVDQEVMRTGLPKIIEEEGININGNKALYLSHKAPLYDQNNQIVGVIGISLDITDAKKEEIAKLQIFKNIIALMPGSIYWKDKKGRFLGCNNYQLKVFGFKFLSEILGKTDLEISERKFADSVMETDQKIMRNKKEVILEEMGRDEFGNTSFYLSKKAPLFDGDGKVAGIVGLSIDITEQKKMQTQLLEQIKQREEAHRSKAEFISTASHEIRNPIGGVLGYLGMLKDEIDGLQANIYGEIFDVLNAAGKSELIKNVKQQFNEIIEKQKEAEKEAWHSLNSLTNIGDLYSLQTEGIATSIEPFNIREFLDETITNNMDINKNKVDICLYVEPGVPAEPAIDYKNICDALVIIIRNAIRFSDDKGLVKIKLDTIEDNQQCYLIISVQDFGCGIANTQLDNLFVSYSDAPSQEKRRYAKPSIQLTRAKMKVEASGGVIDIKSTLGEGTTVLIKVPYQFESVIDVKTDEEISMNFCSVLLVEDNVGIQQIAKQYLGELGYCYDVASTGADAIKLGLENNYDIVFLDITLPDMNGLDVMRAIQQKKGGETLYVALTSHASDDDEDYFISQGVMTVLKKPVTKKQLQECIESALEANADKDD